MGALLELEDSIRALETAENARSRVLLDLVRSPSSDRYNPSLGREDQLQELAEVMQRLRDSVDGADRRELLDRQRELDRGFETPALDLLMVLPELKSHAALDLEAMQAVVDAVGPVLYFYVAAEKTLAALLRPGLPPSVEYLEVGRLELKESIRRFLPISSPTRTMVIVTENRGAALATRLLAPFRDRLPATGPLLIVPHGPLHQLPFDALPDPSDRLVGERFDPSRSLLPYRPCRKRAIGIARPLRAIEFSPSAPGEGLTRPLAEIRSIIDIFGAEYPPGYESTLNQLRDLCPECGARPTSTGRHAGSPRAEQPKRYVSRDRVLPQSRRSTERRRHRRDSSRGRARHPRCL